jgi:hypothetical protein
MAQSMMKSSYTEAQIVAVFPEDEAGATIPELMLHHRFGLAMSFMRQSKRGNIAVTELIDAEASFG